MIATKLRVLLLYLHRTGKHEWLPEFIRVVLCKVIETKLNGGSRMGHLGQMPPPPTLVVEELAIATSD